MARRFKTLTDVRRYMQNVINRLEVGDLDESAAKARAYLSHILTAIIRDSSLEERISMLEERLNGVSKKSN